VAAAQFRSELRLTRFDRRRRPFLVSENRMRAGATKQKKNKKKTTQKTTQTPQRHPQKKKLPTPTPPPPPHPKTQKPPTPHKTKKQPNQPPTTPNQTPPHHPPPPTTPPQAAVVFQPAERADAPSHYAIGTPLLANFLLQPKKTCYLLFKENGLNFLVKRKSL